MVDPQMDVHSAQQAGPAGVDPTGEQLVELGDLEVLQDVETVDRPRAEGWVLALSITAFAVGGVSLATVISLGLGAILDIAGLLAR